MEEDQTEAQKLLYQTFLVQMQQIQIQKQLQQQQQMQIHQQIPMQQQQLPMQQQQLPMQQQQLPMQQQQFPIQLPMQQKIPLQIQKRQTHESPNKAPKTVVYILWDWYNIRLTDINLAIHLETAVTSIVSEKFKLTADQIIKIVPQKAIENGYSMSPEMQKILSTQWQIINCSSVKSSDDILIQNYFEVAKEKAHKKDNVVIVLISSDKDFLGRVSSFLEYGKVFWIHEEKFDETIEPSFNGFSDQQIQMYQWENVVSECEKLAHVTKNKGAFHQKNKDLNKNTQYGQFIPSTTEQKFQSKTFFHKKRIHHTEQKQQQPNPNLA